MVLEGAHTEAATQVGLRVDGRLRFAAARADEQEPAFAAFAGPLQVLRDGPFQGDVVPQAEQQVAREVFGHGKVLSEGEGVLGHRIREVGIR